MEKNDKALQKRVKRQAGRMKQAENDRPTLMGQTVYLGTLGLVFVLPVIGGAYLGRWFDSLAAGYSVRWTLSLIFLGLVIGAINVYLLIREHDHE
ncbi:AtpZ/AtpI family protein [Pontibacterium granulatum]|uniref:AtpZ/AtpI family protein n=1 Tax=Pontibacterium granulatum TaxID=2036029 RepID=UPI00249AF2BF|nr:AtpZ/AtpI family protein [Pontibacterium granulatum]MDI3325629.1 AtpZ/AtpI family protein [Pontibacterium granulatum]